MDIQCLLVLCIGQFNIQTITQQNVEKVRRHEYFLKTLYINKPGIHFLCFVGNKTHNNYYCTSNTFKGMYCNVRFEW